MAVISIVGILEFERAWNSESVGDVWKEAEDQDLIVTWLVVKAIQVAQTVNYPSPDRDIQQSSFTFACFQTIDSETWRA
jgi:hypothetical protein